ncbi:DUF1552 domain-containing protein [Povalibacter sp.]|uniref:DUF1552 domain-containing protein n=1 Tax=Povalibacter sp. TaxID=1962978 RepID=UPI002F3FA8DA
MTFTIPRKLTRRSMLRGVLGGAAVSMGLPILDCHLNTSGTAFAGTNAPLPVRFGTWYWGMGHTPGYAVAEKKQTGPGIGFLEETLPLKPYEQYINYFSGFNMPLDGRSNYTHFTGWVVNRTGSAPSSSKEVPAPTIDLLVADVIGKNSRFLTLDASSSGISRENYSARNTNSRSAVETSPLAVYQRLFGSGFVDPNKSEFKPDPSVMVRRSVLTAFTDQSKDYMKTIGASDRQRLDEYFTAIRQVENQIELQLKAPPPNLACLMPSAPPAELAEQDRVASAREIDNVHETHEIMAKLLAMAATCNQTRVLNMIYTDNFANVRRAGESYTHHLLTHEEAIDPKLGYQPLTFWFQKRSMEALAQYIKVFSSIREGDGTLLDNMLIFATTETNHARVHTIDGVPVYMIGKAGGRMKTGMHVVGGGEPITRVGLTAQKIMGVPVDKWGTKSLQTSRPITEIMV